MDYLLSRYCPYGVVEDGFSGPYWVRNISSKNAFRYFVNGEERKVRIRPGEAVPLDRYIAYQIVDDHNVDVPPLSSVASPGDSVLVIRYGGLGDVLMTTPVVAQAVEDLGIVVDYSTSGYLVRLLQNNPTIRNVYGYTGFDASQYKAVVDLRRYSEAAADSADVHRVDIFARPFGVIPRSYQMRYEVLEAEREAISSIVPEKFIVVQASGSIPRRTLPKPKTIELLGRLVSMGHTPVVVDDQADSSFDIDGVLNLTGKLGIPELFAVVERAQLTIAGDSGVMHASLAVGTKTLGLFGAVAARLRVKQQDHCRTLEVSRWRGCAPCNDTQHVDCKHSETCLEPMPVEAIIEEVEAFGDY